MSYNPEKKEQWWLVVKLLVIVSCAFLYAWGGIEYKWLRRFLAPALAVGTMTAYTRSWKTLIQYPIWCATLSMGYGADTLWGKVARRGAFGLANGASSQVSEILTTRKWLITGFQMLLLPVAYIAFGVFNPFGSARIEETLFGLLMFSVPILTARKKEE